MFFIKDILGVINGKVISGDENTFFESVQTDSRLNVPNSLFIALKGANFDGHDFIKDSGCAACLVNREVYIENCCVVLVQDTLAALQALARFNRQKINPIVIAVTGSVGKTSTKDMIYQVVSKKFKALKTAGNFNNEIGLPLTLLNLTESHEVAVIEMGMRGKGEISELCDIARPDIGIITNIGISHIERLKSKENILKAKLEIFDKYTKTAFLNADDDMLKNVKLSCDTKFYSLVDALNVTDNSFTIFDTDIKLRQIGTHNIHNALAAIYVGRHLGIEMSVIKDALEEFEGTRQQILEINSMTILNDCYNSSPDSLKAALSVLNSYKNRRRVAVIGDMLELGEFSKEAHSDIGKVIDVDFLVAIGKESFYIRKEAIRRNIKCNHYNSNLEFINTFSTKTDSAVFKEGDVILIKGSRGMKMEEIVNHIKGESHE